jgi:hypothetical protein
MLFASTAVSLAGDKESAVEREKAVWQTVQDKKWGGFHKYFANDYRAVYPEGMYDMEQEMAEVRKSDLKSFSFSEVTAVFPNDDTAVLTYKVAAQGTQDGKDMSGLYYCASVWHKRGAEWTAVFHTEVVPQR